MNNSLQSRGRVQSLTASFTVGIALVALTSEVADAAPQSVTYLQQVDIARSPDDVAVTPGAGGIAVIRASEHWYAPTGPVADDDEIVITGRADLSYSGEWPA